MPSERPPQTTDLSEVRHREAERRMETAQMLAERRAALADAEISRTMEAIASQLRSELKEEDRGWQRIDQVGFGYDIGGADRADIRQKCAKLWQIDGIAGQIVALTGSGTFGAGVQVPRVMVGDNESREEKRLAKAAQAILGAFWDDPDNQAAFTSWEAQIVTNVLMFIDGERFFTLHSSAGDWRVKLADIPCSEITEVVTAPGNRLRPVLYKREWRPASFNFEKGAYDSSSDQKQVAYYLDASFAEWMRDEDQRISPDVQRLIEGAGGKLIGDVHIQHVKVNTVGKRGIPHLYRVYDWARAHSRSVSDLTTLAKSLAMFAWQRTVKTNSAATLKKFAEQDMRPTPGPGAVRTSNDKVEMDPVNVSSGGVGNLEAAARQTKLQAIGASGYGEHWFGDASCYTADTEVLTEHGWRVYSEVTEGARIACYDPQTHNMTWEQPLELHEYEIDAEIVRIHSQTQDIAVTPNHRMLVRPITQWERLPAEGPRPAGKAGRPRIADGGVEQIDRDYQVVEAGDLAARAKGWKVRTAPDVVEEASPWITPHPAWEQVSAIDFGAFIGWFVSEGSTLGDCKRNGESRDRTYHRVHFSQNPGPAADAIRQLLGRLPWNVTEQDCNGCLDFQLVNKDLWGWLRANCGTGSNHKRLPKGFATWPRAVLEALWDAAVAGDGTRCGKDGRCIAYKSTSKQLVDDLQIVALILGYRANLGKTTVSENSKHADIYVLNCCPDRETGVYRTQITHEDYKGIVWCYQVRTGFYVTRRNGKIAIQGNTGNLATATAMELPAVQRLEGNQTLFGDLIETLCHFQLRRAQAYGKAIAVQGERYTLDDAPYALDVNFPPATPRTPESAATLLPAITNSALAGYVEPREASYQIYEALGANNIAELLEKQYGEDGAGVRAPQDDATPPDDDAEADTDAAEGRQSEAMGSPFGHTPQANRIEKAFAAALDSRVISPWLGRVRLWLREQGETPPASPQKLDAAIRTRLRPDAVKLRQVLGEYHLRTANAAGQYALNKISGAIARARPVVEALVREAEGDEDDLLLLSEKLRAGQQWNEQVAGLEFFLRDPRYLRVLQQRGEKITGDVSNTMLADLRDVLNTQIYREGQSPLKIARELEDIFPVTYRNRGENIARTEVAVAQGLMTQATYEENGVDSRQWYALLDGSTRADHAAAHGQVKPMGRPFDVGGTQMMHPGDPDAPVEQVARCRCDMLPVIGNNANIPNQPWVGGYQPNTDASRRSAGVQPPEDMLIAAK